MACMVAKDPLLTSLFLQWLFLCGLFQFRSCQGFSGEMPLASPLLCTACGILLNLEQVVLLSSPTEWPLLAPLTVRHISGQLGALQPCYVWSGQNCIHVKLLLRHDLQQRGLVIEAARQDFSATCGSQCLKVLMMVVEG